MIRNQALAGLDVGSTTVKIVVIDSGTGETLYSSYVRHDAEQAAAAVRLLREAHRLLPDTDLRLSVCGSGGRDIAAVLGAFFVQEVVATALAVSEEKLRAGSAIELGGQDAKVIFFREEDGRTVPHEMRMNGSCAGGTGAFLDQMAGLLQVPVEELGSLAARGTTVYDVSGRCGVFAKTDVQPLLHQGAAVEDIALSCLHAVAKQTIGGLAQGLRFDPPVLFAGGPLTFNPALVRVFQERLGISEAQTVVPPHAELFIARGAAHAGRTLFAGKVCDYAPDRLTALGCGTLFRNDAAGSVPRPFFETDRERALFVERHGGHEGAPAAAFTVAAPVAAGAPQPSSTRAREGAHARRAGYDAWPEPSSTLAREGARPPAGFASLSGAPAIRPGDSVSAYLGIDAGSTTTKFALVDDGGNVRYTFYRPNGSDPIAVARQGLAGMREHFRKCNVDLRILGVGTTGYGEILFAKAFHADLHQVETVAHARAASHYMPDVSFILDIGGQDMKAIRIKDGVITDIILNEACSAGCGSFLETYSRSLGVAPGEIADIAFASRRPSTLGSRCTVFMNSSIITEQKNGKGREDILAGLCRSIITNVFTKVVRISNLDSLGSRILVQGGTFRNLAVLRAMEEYLGRDVHRPPYPGEMGAIGVALLARDDFSAGRRETSSFVGLDAIGSISYTRRAGVVCTGCANTCSRTVVTFADGAMHITGNRCERGEVISIAAPASHSTPAAQGAAAESREEPVDLLRRYERDLAAAHSADRSVTGRRRVRLGIPRVLEFYRSLPFWTTLFESLGFEVVVSARSTSRLFESGLSGVPSDTVCLPAKLAHGHIRDLARKKVDRIFFPMMIRVPRESVSALGSETCPIIQGYPVVTARNEDEVRDLGIPIDTPAFHFFDDVQLRSQVRRYLRKLFDSLGTTTAACERGGRLHVARGISRAPRTLDPGRGEAPGPREISRALRAARRALEHFEAECRSRGREAIDMIDRTAATQPGYFGVVIAGRPYHNDDFVNHGLSRHFGRLGIPAINLESVPDLADQDVSGSRLETFNPFHTRMLSAAQFVATQANLELVQIVSFGCGHDAILSDEMARILREMSGKDMLILKVDEGDAAGPLSIRIRSFVESVRRKRARTIVRLPQPLGDPYPVKFRREDIARRTIYAPVLSEGFTRFGASTLRKLGFRAEALPAADALAIELGKRYVHNDICFPAQLNIGEMLRELKTGAATADAAAFGLAQNCTACRAGHYPALARKALDDAGYREVPIITTGKDVKRMHPGLRLSPVFHLDMLLGLTIIDALEEMRQVMRPYETVRGTTDAAFAAALGECETGLRRSWSAALRGLAGSVRAFNTIPVDRSHPRPRVGILGEILVNYHESANSHVQRYLEDHGMETVIPGMVDFFRKKDIVEISMAERNLHPRPVALGMIARLKERAYELVRRKVDGVLGDFRYARPRHSFTSVHRNIEGLIDKSYMIGEGWLMPAEILQMAKEGVRSFLILNPFGCMPNHVSGRGMIKRLKELYAGIRILALDFDPDTSWGNIENRLQMLVMSAAGQARS